jgi:lysophospholipase L1-like esterase
MAMSLALGLGLGMGGGGTAAPSAPVNSVAPVISGTATQGSTLTTTNGTWTGSPTFTYQWKRGSTSIGGATASTYALTGIETGANVTCVVTGTNVAGSASATSNALGPVSFEGLIATRCRARLSNSGVKDMNSRTGYVATDAITSLKIAYANFRLLATQQDELGLGGTITVSASVEYPAATFTRIQWGGANSKLMADAALEISDATTIAGGIPAGDTFWIRLYESSATGVIFCSFRNATYGDLLETNAAQGGLSDKTLGGSIGTGSASAPVLAIIGQTTKRSVCLIGDSITHGFGDTAEATPATPGIRGAIAKSFPETIPFVNLSTGSIKAQDVAGGTYWLQRPELLPYFSHYVVSLGNNDIFLGGRSAAQTKADLETINAAIIAANAHAKITHMTITPRSTSTDSWATTVNQTTHANDSIKDTLNATIRASGVTGQNNGFFEVATQIESAVDSGIWTATGGAKTADGIHPNASGYNLVVTNAAIDYDTKFVIPYA